MRINGLESDNWRVERTDMTKTKFYLLYGWSFVAYWILMLTPDPVVRWAAKHGFHGNGSRLWDFLLWMYGESSMYGYSVRYDEVQQQPGPSGSAGEP